ncbi:hypothetical protein IC614_04575 [Allosphingosinicella flava]|uniref:Uncharacterized protein n=1 Tax=Allosphingosinicella flava TaxID=2771430 RepID=A0A7T2GL52_9SPHN|nr:hypothetical protein [Sphingosinicella flava]QPQ55865.1 hypothetical protein IC614_04575 [Sphingosinicella flava]
MQLKHILAVSAATLAIGLAAPSVAQDSSVNEAGPGSSDNNDVGSYNDVNSYNDDNGNNRDNDVNSYNDDNGNNRDNEVEDNGDNRDNENYGSWSASRGGEIEDSGNTLTGNSEAEDSYNDNSGQAEIVATQVLIAVNSNSELDEVADFDGEDDTESSVGYNSGDQSVNGNSFSAFAGILNQAWNTGLNANVQAATNIAAQGTVTFGDGGAAADDGGAGGGD